MLEETTAYDFYKDYEVNNDDSLGCTTLIMPDEKFTFLNFPYINNRGEIKSLLGRHEYTAYEIIKEQYGLDLFPKDLDRIISEDVRNISLDERIKNETDPKKIPLLIFKETGEKLKPYFDYAEQKLNDCVPGGVKNAIMISYVYQDSFQFVSITLPAYITSFQKEQLLEVNEELKKIDELLKEKQKDNYMKTLIGVTFDKFNPITQKDENIEEFRINNDCDGIDDFEKGKVNDPIKAAVDYMEMQGKIKDNIKNNFRVFEKVNI